jgi:hypothetical protein
MAVIRISCDAINEPLVYYKFEKHELRFNRRTPRQRSGIEEDFSAASVASCEEPTLRAGVGLDQGVRFSNQPVHRTGAQPFGFGSAGKFGPWIRSQSSPSGSGR